MKKPMICVLLLTAGVMAVRILLEELGAPGGVTNILGVAWLHILVPLYLAIAADLGPRPYLGLLGVVAFYTVAARLLVVASYSLAYLFRWSAFRFSTEGGGVVGEGVSALDGLLLTPLGNQPFWVVAGVAVGMLAGSAALLIRRRTAAV